MQRQEVASRFHMLLMMWSIFVASFGTGFPTTRHKNVAHKAHAHLLHTNPAQYDPEESEQHNQVQSLLPEPQSSQRRWSHPQHRSVGVLPQPEPEEENTPFMLDLKNLPELRNANMDSQNPNIQVSIEVVDDSQMEVEMDLMKEKEWLPPSPSSTVDWVGGKKLFWPLFWSYTDSDSSEENNSRSSTEDTVEEEEEEDYSVDYGSEEPLPSGVGGDWESRWNEGWDPVQNYYETESDEWTPWSPCSVTCGHGEKKRTKSCGFSCTLTEASRCELDPCPGDDNTVTDYFPFEMENGTEAFGTDVDSCEKWLSCKSDFLQQYMELARSELPQCPCSYPSDVSYTVVSVFDEAHDRPFRWRDASGPKERLDIYKPSARSCIRSALSADFSTLAVQHCCYDDRGRLITRGKSAGTPNLISTEFSPELHFKVDVLPWILCKGDWSRFHTVRPPNNGLNCPENPHEDVFMNELEEAREF